MKSNKFNYVIIGLFVVIILAGVITSISFLTGQRGATVQYLTVYDNVTGIKYGTQVLYEGYRIGQVETVNPVERSGQMRFEIILSIDDDWIIPDDSIARIEAPTLLSPIVINIHAGDSTVALAQGAEIPSEEASNIFNSLTTVAAQVAELGRDLKPVLIAVERVSTDIAVLLEGDGGKLITEVKVTLGHLNKRLPKILDELALTLAALSDVANSDNPNSIPGILANTNKLVSDLRGLSAVLGQTLAKVDGTVDDANGVIGDVGGVVKNVDGLVTDAKGLVKNVTNITKNADSMVANANAIVGTVKGAAETVDLAVKENSKAVRAMLADLRHVSDALARHIDSIAANVEGASRNFNELGRRLRNDPSILLRGSETGDDRGTRR
ncbi:MAG: MlaD family protein [Magnetospiraceae bacterium]